MRYSLLAILANAPVLQNKLGGGEGIEGLYGTLACSGMQKVLECMSAKCGMTSDSRLVDMGAGIGRLVSQQGFKACMLRSNACTNGNGHC